MDAEARWTNIKLALGVLALCSIYVIGALFDPAVKDPQSRPSPSQAGLTGLDGLPNYMLHPQAAAEKVDELAERSGGNFDRLSDREQAWLNAMTAGHGADLIRTRLERRSQQPDSRNDPSGRQ